jgi:hypothetical protein
MLRVSRSGGCALITAAQWESIKIDRTQHVSVVSPRYVADQSEALEGVDARTSHPAGGQQSAGRGDGRCARGITCCGRLRTSPGF